MTIQEIDSYLKEHGYTMTGENGKKDQRYFLKMIKHEGEEFSVHICTNVNTLSTFFSFLQLKGFCQITTVPFLLGDENDFEKRERDIVSYAALCLQIDIEEVFDLWKNLKPEIKSEAKSAKINDVPTRKDIFWKKVIPLAKEKGFTKEQGIEFRDYWTEIGENGKKMRFEMEKVFDISRRLNTWQKNITTFAPKKNFSEKKAEQQNKDKVQTVTKSKSDLF